MKLSLHHLPMILVISLATASLAKALPINTPFPKAADEPENFCTAQACSLPMRQISDAYKVGTLPPLNIDPKAYSGACYHLNPSYNAEDQHYGVTSFEVRNNGQVLINGFFGFFYQNDPYEHSRASEIVSDLNRKYAPSQGLLFANHIESRFWSETAQITYWYRTSQDQTTLLLIGQSIGIKESNWENYSFCALSKRP